MLDLEEIKSIIQEFERRQEEIDGYKADLDEDLKILADDDENFRINNADVLTNGSQNPVKKQREKRERDFLLLDERDKELNELSDEIAEIEEKLNQEVDKFVKVTIEKIQEEKNRINTEVQEPEISINRLNDEKQKLESDRKRLSELIELAESRKVRADDSIYQDLKRREKNANSRIAEIDKELEELNPDRLSDLWDELDRYEKNIEGLEGKSKDKINTLCNMFNVNTHKELRQEAEEQATQETKKVESKAPETENEVVIDDIDKGLNEQAKREEEQAKSVGAAKPAEPAGAVKPSVLNVDKALLIEAIKLAGERGKGARLEIGALQRIFKIGFNRAESIQEILKEKGILELDSSGKTVIKITEEEAKKIIDELQN